MLNSKLSLSLAVAVLIQSGHAFAGDDTHGGQAVSNAVQASGHASASAAHSVAASGQVTSAASAMPLSIGGAVLISGGVASVGAAHGSMKAATSPVGKPLKITDESITVTPPNEALKRKDDKKSDGKKS